MIQVCFLVQRFRCKSRDTCGRTFSVLPPVALALKRYAAAVVQGAWEDHVDSEAPLTLEKIAERWDLKCVQTIQRWLHPLKSTGDSLAAGLRRLLPYTQPGEDDSVGGDQLLRVARLVAASIPLASPLDRSRVPYHFVMQQLIC